MSIKKAINKAVARATSRFPAISRFVSEGREALETAGEIPWSTPKPLCEATVALVTTAGVHHKDQRPFDMQDPHGDPSVRVIDVRRPLTSLMITHDYYDHRDADKDINIVFPIERLWEFQEEGALGKVAELHYSFMGHIEEPHVKTLVEKSAPWCARELASRGVDVVVLTPG
ncbi:MAG: glycine/sarcosine/betaine reductase selenoprotein B family protein [Nitrospirota bacterium]|jgi:D-proline reductase (dithiol) PrdB